MTSAASVDRCECGADAGDISFDRSICACGSMHYFCNQCGTQAEPCADETPEPPAANRQELILRPTPRAIQGTWGDLESSARHIYEDRGGEGFTERERELAEGVLVLMRLARREGQARDDLAAKLERAAFVAEHLFQMIDPQTWRDSGAIGPEGQYEGEYRAEQVRQEIESWKEPPSV